MSTKSEIRRQGCRGRAIGTALVVAVWAALLGPFAAARPARADTTFDSTMLTLINEQRAAAGVGPVQASLLLNTLAGPGPYVGCGLPIGGRAVDMGQRNYFSHTILNCGTQSVFSILSGTVGLVYSAAGENIAWMNGTTDPSIAAQNLMSSLMNSPGHKANILDPRFNAVGIGSWHTTAGQTWSGGGTALTNVWITAQVFAQLPGGSVSTAPVASLSPTSLAFGDRAVGGAAATQAVTVQNSGNGPLSVTGTSITGTNAADFSVVSNSCGTTTAPGASCTVVVGFAPGAAGSRSATLSITDNAAGSPHAVAVGGSGSTSVLPGPPTGVSALGGDGRLTVSWTAPASGAAPTGYGVYVYDANGFTGLSAAVCGTCTSAAVTGIPNGKQYYAVVYGNNGTASGAGGTSNWASVLAVPGAPGNAIAVAGDGQLTMSWTPPATPSAGIDGYGVVVYDAKGYTGKYVWVCSTCTSATVAGLTNGTSYYPAVYAHNANGWGAGGVWNWLVVGTPGAPSNVVATKGAGSVSVTWAPATVGVATLDGYGAVVYDDAGYTGKYLWVCATCADTATFTGLASGKHYTVQVYSHSAYGWGESASTGPITL